MADQMTPSTSIMDHIIAALRGRKNPEDHSKRPADMQMSGWHEYLQECKASGEDPMSYDQWIKQQGAVGE